MGMIDQRGEWRRVVTDGQRQAHAQGPGQDKPPPSVEQRGIRLLPESDAATRLPGRVGPPAVRTGAEDSEHEPDPGSESLPGPGERPVEEPSRVERPQRLRTDAAHG